ncbi:UNVERIFIED_CONTAM: hypothetical protein FKN15_040226 [Acipenser sinensis]
MLPGFESKTNTKNMAGIEAEDKHFPNIMYQIQLSMLFTEECDKVRDLMHVHSFSYDFHLRVVHQYLVGCQMTLRQGYQLTSFLEDFIAHHPDIPKFGRNHVFQGVFSFPTGVITAHQLYNYITDHAGTYNMKPLRMSKSALSDGRKGAANAELHEYALVALWNRISSAPKVVTHIQYTIAYIGFHYPVGSVQACLKAGIGALAGLM